MGWTETIATHFDKRGNIDRKAEIANIISDHYKILKSSMVGSVWYGAVAHVKRYKKDNEGKCIPNGTKNEYDNYITEDIPVDEQEVEGVVCLTSSRTENRYIKWFGYKMIDESCGPFYYDCPDSILNLLTPTDYKSANEWREKCREYKRKKKELNKLPVGSVIKFTFNNKDIQIKLEAPAYQFKTPWWSRGNGYFPKKNIPLSYEIVA